MTGIYRLEGQKGRASWGAPLLGLLCAAALTGCGSLLDVSNPNNVLGDEVEKPQVGTNLANGVLARVAHGVVGEALVYQTATDEFAWKGSRDGFRELDQGKLSNAFNEFTDGFFSNLAQARWMGDEAIKVLEAQDAASTIGNRTDLARTYLYAAIAYVSIANMFDDWALSDRRTSVAPVGPTNMGGFYDTAIGYLTKGLAISGITTTLQRDLTAMRARANFDRAIWETVNPPRAGAGIVTNSAYVAAAVADANAALALNATDWAFQFTFSSGTGSSDQGAWINSRQENRLGGTYVKLHATDPTWVDTTVLMDPVDNVPAPFVHATQRGFKAAVLYPSYTVISAREMHLILAEAALAGAATGGTFQSHINALRALDGVCPVTSGTCLTAWTPASTVTATDLLVHSRQANLFLQSRRLSDHYRFNVPSVEWQAGSQALVSPGIFLPIAAVECLSNTEIGAAKCST